MAKDAGSSRRFDLKKRLRKKSNGLPVESVVGKLTYQSPKGRLTYSAQDLKYDLQRGYLKLKAASGKTSAKATEQAKSPGRSPICLEDVILPTGKVAQCALAGSGS